MNFPISKNLIYLGIIKLFSVFANFLLTYVVVRSFSSYESGLFFFALTGFIFISGISRFGLDLTIVRFLSVSFKNKNSSEVKYIYWLSFISVVSISTLVSLSIIFFKDYIGLYQTDPQMINALSMIILCSLLMNINAINAYCMQAIKKQKLMFFYLNVAFPILMVIFICLSPYSTFKEIYIMFFIIYALIAIASSINIYKFLYIPKKGTNKLDIKIIFKSASNNLGIYISNEGLALLGIILVGFFLPGACQGGGKIF